MGKPPDAQETPPTWTLPVLAVRLPLIALGLAAGGVGFAGFFVDFFSNGGGGLSALSSGWFDLVPIFIGLSALALLIPGPGRLVSSLSLISFGMAFGVRGIVAEAASRNTTASYGTGFWMIVIGSAFVTLASWVLIILDRRGKSTS